MEWASEAKRKDPASLGGFASPPERGPILPASVVSRGYLNCASITQLYLQVKTWCAHKRDSYGGGGGICTRDCALLRYPILAFQASAFVYSATPPSLSAVGQHCFKDVRIMPVVEPEYEFIQVGLEVFGGHSVIDADDCSLEQAPEAFNTHGMDVSVHERPGMAHSGVGIASGSSLVALEFIGAEEFSVSADDGIEHFSKCNCLHIRDFAGNHLPSAFLDAKGNPFARSTTASLAASAATANVGLIGFNDPGELIFEPIPWPHGLADLHSHAPRSLVGDSEGAFKLLPADAFLGVDHQMRGSDPAFCIISLRFDSFDNPTQSRWM